jgi:hypothetical protein
MGKNQVDSLTIRNQLIGVLNDAGRSLSARDLGG